jgi:hypothetical protein
VDIAKKIKYRLFQANWVLKHLALKMFPELPSVSKTDWPEKLNFSNRLQNP